MNLLDWAMIFVIGDAALGDRKRHQIKTEEKEYARQNNLPEPIFEPTPYTIGDSRAIFYVLFLACIVLGCFILMVIIAQAI